MQAGDSVTLHIPSGDFTFAVSGFCDDEWEKYDSKFEDVTAYMSVGALDAICGANRIGKNSDMNVTDSGKKVMDTGRIQAVLMLRWKRRRIMSALQTASI